MAMDRLLRRAPLAFVVMLALACTDTNGASPTPGSSASPAPSATPPPSPSAAPNADTAVIRIENVGGFMPPQMILRRYPDAVLYSDGRLITQGPVDDLYPGPALPNLVL